MNKDSEEVREEVKVDESILGEGAWERGTPGQFQQSREAISWREGGWAMEDTHRPGAQGPCGQDLTSLRSVQAGREGPYATRHLTDLRVREPGGLTGFSASGLMD